VAQIGTAFKVAGIGCHLWVVISEPDSEGMVVCVNLTDSNNYPDSSCHLKVGDHAFITKPSAIMYKKARMWKDADIDDRLVSGKIIQHEDFRPDIIKLVIDGALRSDDLPPFLHAQIKPLS